MKKKGVWEPNVGQSWRVLPPRERIALRRYLIWDTQYQLHAIRLSVGLYEAVLCHNKYLEGRETRKSSGLRQLKTWVLAFYVHLD
jgi:hypothetical protein